MKKIFLITILLANFSFYAQGQRGGRPPQNQNRQGAEQRTIKEFKASDVAGIFYYDIQEVIKKIKVRNENTQNTVTKALKNYNSKTKEIAFLNSEKFRSLDAFMKSNRGSQRKRIVNDNDFDDDTQRKDNFRQKVGKIIRPVRNEIRENEEILNETLETVLSEKQLKKWLKYQKKQKEKLTPKRPDRNQNRGQLQNGNRQQRRF